MSPSIRRAAMVAALLLPVLAIAAAAGAADRPQPPPPTPVGGTLSPYPARLATPADRIEPPRISAASALLVDLDGGGVLFRRDPRQPRPVASLTKLMTALVVLRSTPPDQVVTVSRGAVFDDREFGSSSTLGLRAGERLSVRDLLYAALVGSANDAARALAIHVAGSEEAFVRRMNRAADRLGMRATEFRSATGLDDRGVSTAADLRRLAEVVLEQPVLARAVSTRFHRMPGPNRPRIVQSRNALLWLYPGATGMKTGSTRGAGACLIATAERDGRHLLAIVLGAPVEAFSDAAALLNHGFDGFSVRRLVAAGEAFGGVDLRGGSVGVAAADDLSALVPIADSEVRTVVRVDRAATFPPAPNEPVGEVRVVSGDLVLGRVALVATDVPPPPPTGGPPWWVRAAGAVARGVGGLLSAFFD